MPRPPAFDDELNSLRKYTTGVITNPFQYARNCASCLTTLRGWVKLNNPNVNKAFEDVEEKCNRLAELISQQETSIPGNEEVRNAQEHAITAISSLDKILETPIISEKARNILS